MRPTALCVLSWCVTPAASGRDLRAVLRRDTIVLTADLKNWGESIRLSIQPHARYAASEFTSAKILSWAANLRWAERAQEQGFDEVVLLNEMGRVSECTSANIFAAFGNQVVTPPISEGCLPGVTRDVLVHEIHVPDVEVIERPLTVEELYRGRRSLHHVHNPRPAARTRDRRPARSKAAATPADRLGRAFLTYLRADIARRKTAVAV